MKLSVLFAIFCFTTIQAQSETDFLLEAIGWKKDQIQKPEGFRKFCPSCDLNYMESATSKKTVVQSNHVVDKRSTYFFNFNEDGNVESMVMAGYKGLIDNHSMHFWNMVTKEN